MDDWFVVVLLKCQELEMIILNTKMKKEDLEFVASEIKRLMNARDPKNQSKSSLKELQERNLEKNIIPLAERGQIEAMQKYCESLSPLSTMNSKIVSNFHKIEQKSVKEPREFLALSSFYNWFVEYYKNTYSNINVESLEEYQKARNYYRTAGQMLFQLGKTDPIAKESAFLMQKRNREELTPEEYRRSMSNSRNVIFATANRQTNENLRMKLMIRYCENLVSFAPENEYTNRQSIVTTVIASVQKRMIILDEMNRD